MSNAFRSLRRLPARIVGGLALPLVLPAIAPAAADVAIMPQAAVAGAEAIRVEGETAVAAPVAPADATPAGAPAAADVGTEQARTEPAETVPTLGLAECIRTALAQQPNLAAQRASLASAEASRQALEELRVPTFIARDLPIRRQQAALGVT